MSSNTENIPPQVIKRVMKEISEIKSAMLEGITLVTNETDVCDIQALIDGPQSTPYMGGLFRVKLVLCKGFPAQPPKAYFLTKIFHPNVAANGEICVNTLKRDWSPDLGIKHILLTIKCLLIVPNPESALNEEAGKLLLEAYDEYFTRAKLYTEVHARHSLAQVHKSSSTAAFDLAATSSTSSTSSTAAVTPLDASKTLNNNAAAGSAGIGTGDEPNSKMAKLQQSATATSAASSQAAAKKNDKKKALKRL